ncbi:helix-turn-helix domain-containing protein [Flavobacterium ginsenosidimutans]|uniref:helix-turn-helix domain-containing protein n=1 Tax=Flavobacterium ginsenosidimutans TaxID=687844 RepID=UPI003D951FE4
METKIEMLKTLAEVRNWFGISCTEFACEDFMLQEIDTLNQNKLLKTSNSYKANFFTIFIIYEGSATHLYNNKEMKLESSSIFITTPGYFRNYKINHISKAYFICFTENFIANYCIPDIYKKFPFLLSDSFMYTIVDFQNYQIVKSNIDQIKQETKKEYQDMILIGNMLEFLLIKISELFHNQSNPILDKNINSSVVNRFYQDLDKHFDEVLSGKKPKQLKAGDFAALQFLNEDYFCRIIKTKTGRTPTTWINCRLLAEAKTLLTETSTSITEICSLFQFTDNRSFSRYFKKQTTMTPNEYRKNLQSLPNL